MVFGPTRRGARSYDLCVRFERVVERPKCVSKLECHLSSRNSGTKAPEVATGLFEFGAQQVGRVTGLVYFNLPTARRPRATDAFVIWLVGP